MLMDIVYIYNQSRCWCVLATYFSYMILSQSQHVYFILLFVVSLLSNVFRCHGWKQRSFLYS